MDRSHWRHGSNSGMKETGKISIYPSKPNRQHVLKPVLSPEEIKRRENYIPERPTSDDEFEALVEQSREKGRVTVYDLNESKFQ